MPRSRSVKKSKSRSKSRSRSRSRSKVSKKAKGGNPPVTSFQGGKPLKNHVDDDFESILNY